jgi:hypothetical protein
MAIFHLHDIVIEIAAHGCSMLNASSTFPGVSLTTPYPEPTKSMPPATVGPGALMEPPWAATPPALSPKQA